MRKTIQTLLLLVTILTAIFGKPLLDRDSDSPNGGKDLNGTWIMDFYFEESDCSYFKEIRLKTRSEIPLTHKGYEVNGEGKKFAESTYGKPFKDYNKAYPLELEGNIENGFLYFESNELSSKRKLTGKIIIPIPGRNKLSFEGKFYGDPALSNCNGKVIFHKKLNK